MELSKNNRFRTGSTVDIYHTPVYETNTLNIIDVSVGDDYVVEALFEEDLSNEQFSAGDLCAMSFGVGEIMPTAGTLENLLLHSEQADNAVWDKEYIDVTADDIAYPSGGYSADKLHTSDTSGASRQFYINQFITKVGSPSTYTWSCYVKGDEYDYIRLGVYDKTRSTGAAINFWISGSSFATPIETYGFVADDWGSTDEGNGWRRVWITVTSNSLTSVMGDVQLLNNTEQTFFQGDGLSGVHVRGMQLKEGVLDAYVESQATPIVAALIPARTQTGSNLLLHSEDIDNAVWIPTNVNIAPDSNYNPDYMFTPADNLAATITTGEHKVVQTITKDASVKTYTVSAHIIENSTSTLQLKVKSAGGSCSAMYDCEQNQFNIGQDTEVGAFTIIDKGNDLMVGSTYQRFWITFQSSADTELDVELGLVWGFSSTNFGGQVVAVDVAAIQLEEYTQVGEYKITTDAIVEPISIGSILKIQFPKSMFPDSNVDKYVGAGIQHALFFLKTGRVVANFAVAKYKEEVKQAVYGYAKVIYNLQTEADLVLTPITMVDDGTLNAILYSKGFVLGACDTSNYTPSGGWNTEFPLELSGTSIDPIYRRAYLKKRAMTSSGRKAKAKLEFRLVG